MTDTEATTLIARIKHTWRGGPHPDVWREVLLELDAGTAGTTIVRLARDLDDAPSIAAFLRTYRSLNTPANNPIPEPQPPCPTCHGDGWQSIADRHVIPCHCPAGQQRAAVYRKIIDDNARTLTTNGIPVPTHRTPEVQAWLDSLHLDDTTPLQPDDPKAQAAFALGYTQGIAELDAERTDESA